MSYKRTLATQENHSRVPTDEDLANWSPHGDYDAPATTTAAEKHQNLPLPFRPFPTHVLPAYLRDYVQAGAAAIGCDESFVGLPLLVATGAAVGTKAAIELKRGWRPFPILWAAIVGESGDGKSPPFRAVMQLVRRRQAAALEDHQEQLRLWEIDKAHHEKALAKWKRDSKDITDPPELPEPPRCVRHIVSDVTVEALAPILLDNPQGVLLARDELSGWLGSFDKYSGRGGADAAHWLSMHSGESIVVDRKSGAPNTIYIPTAAVSVVGSIQPGILNRALGQEHRENGLAARLLLAAPPRRQKRWTEADIDPYVEQRVERLLGRLYDLPHLVDEDGHYCPHILQLSPEAKREWVAWYDAHAAETADLTGDLAAAWSKLEELPPRLAIVLQLAESASAVDRTQEFTGEDEVLSTVDTVDISQMKAAIELAEWFKNEARRVYSRMGESESDRDVRELIEWIDRRGGRITPRELQRGYRKLREPGTAEAALENLVRAGLGTWTVTTSGSSGGRPARYFQSINVVDSRQNLESNGYQEGSVDAGGGFGG